MVARTANIFAFFVLVMEFNLSIAVIGVSPTDSSDSLQTVFGVAGNKVSLPCNVTAPTEDDAVALVLWYKDDSTSPYYSLDARRGSVSQARHASSDAASDRAYFSITNRPGILQLDPLLEEDEGFYRCRVDFRKGRTRNSDIVLTVIVPPKKPIITDHSGEIQQSLIGPYNEGDRLVLVCESEGGKPLPVVTWWRESVLLDDSYDVSPLGIVRNELELPSLQRHDLMAVYTCQASNNNFSQPSSTSVTVDMNFPPLEVEIEGDRNPLSSGRTAQVVCKVNGSRPPAAISWWLDKVQLKQSRESVSVDGYVTSSILEFTPTSNDHNKQLICRAHNTFIPSSVLQDVWKLEVHYSPKVNLRIGSNANQSQIYEGSDVYLECNVISNPPARNILWEFDGEELRQNVSHGIIIRNQSLIIQRIQRRHKGSYKCVVTNSEGKGESNTVFLRVLYSPFCKPSQKIIYGAAKQEAIQITCEVEADPAQVKFHWEFNNTLDNTDVVDFKTEGTKSIATYVLRSQYDYGTLMCLARNEVGSQREPCVYTVVPAGPPDQVENCTVSNKTQDAIYVECQPGYNWGLKQHFVLEIHDKDFRRVILNVTSEKPSFQVKDLPTDMPFIFVIYAVNNKGRSQSVRINTSTSSSLGGHTISDGWKLAFHPTVIIICSVVVGLIITGILVLVLAKFRKNIYTKMNPAKRRNSKEPREEDKLSLHHSLTEEKCPDLISGRKFQNESDQILDTTLLQSALSRSRSSDIELTPEEKEADEDAHCIRHTCEFAMATELNRMAISRITPTVYKLQTEV